MSRDITDPERRWLAEEIEAWRGLGLVSLDQAKSILALYATSQENIQRRHSKAMNTLMALAAVLVALGVLLLIGYNWDAIPSTLKVVAIFGVILAAHGTGFILRFKHGLRKTSEVAFFFGCLLYGAGIWLLAQIFHINAENADGFWWWAVGVLPFALVFDTVLLHVLFVALMAIWAGVEVFGYANLGTWIFGRRPYLPDGAYSLLVLCLPGFWWAYRKQSLQAISLYVPLIAWWVVLQPFAWKLEANPVYFIGAVGCLLLLVSEAHPEGSRMAIPYRAYGGLLLAAVLIPLSYKAFNDHHDVLGGTTQDLYLTCAIVVLAAVSLTAIVPMLMRSRPGLISAQDAVFELVKREFVPVGMLLLMTAFGFWNAIVGEALLPTVLANVAMIVFALWLIQVGLRNDRGTLFVGGVAYFLLWAVLRYIDLFGEFGGMLGAAVVFFLCGATLFGVALFWRQRKAVQVV